MKTILLVAAMTLAALPGLAQLQEPCDILATAGTPCIAAHSVTRRMLAAYTGYLFQLERTSDSTTLNVGSLSTTGLVNIAPIAAFCASTTCKFSIIYDQMNTPSMGNNLPQATAADQAPLSWTRFANFTELPIVTTVSGDYYRNRASTVNMPTGSSPITEYMVVSTVTGATCCGTYGDMESTVEDKGDGAMFALAYSTGSGGTVGTGSGPWPGVDWENGVYLYGATPAQAYLSILAKYATSGPSWELKSGDATTGSLTTLYNGALPSGYSAAFEGGLSLGEGGDGSAAPTAFLEGAVIASTTTDATDNAVQSNITAFYSNPLSGTSTAQVGGSAQAAGSVAVN